MRVKRCPLQGLGDIPASDQRLISTDELNDYADTTMNRMRVKRCPLQGLGEIPASDQRLTSTNRLPIVSGLGWEETTTKTNASQTVSPSRFGRNSRFRLEVDLDKRVDWLPEIQQ